MSFDPCLHFQGNCAEAMQSHAETFGGTLRLMRYSEAPPQPGGPRPEQARDLSASQHIMHAALTFGGRRLLASNCPDGREGAPQASVSVSHGGPARAKAGRISAALAQGGAVIAPFGDAFRCDGFGMAKDRFGTHWMIGGPSRM